MKLNRKHVFNIGSITSRGRFAVLHYTRKGKVHPSDSKFFDKWTNGPNTYYRAGSLAWRIRKEETCDDISCIEDTTRR